MITNDATTTATKGKATTLNFITTTATTITDGTTATTGIKMTILGLIETVLN